MARLGLFKRGKFTLRYLFSNLIGELEELLDVLLCHKKRDLKYPLSRINIHNT